jgi:hypothetical protein
MTRAALRGCLILLIAVGLSLVSVRPAPGAARPSLELKKGDVIVILGNTFAERMQYFGHFETLLHSRFPDLELVVRDLGWSADELTLWPRSQLKFAKTIADDDGKDDELMLRPRSEGFRDHGHNLTDHKPDVVIACFGFNESFAGRDGLKKFEEDVEKFIAKMTTTKFNGKAPPRLALVSPIAHEDLKRLRVADCKENNKNLKLYTEAMAKVAEKHGVVFVDLFTPTRQLMEKAEKPLTFNGVHLTASGDKQVAPLLDEGLFGARPVGASRVDYEKLRAEVNEKNLQFWYDYRAVNGCYIYGGRKKPFGVVNFPDEFVKLRKMIAKRDQRVWAVAQGKAVPARIDDSDTGELKEVVTNFTGKVTITPPGEAIKSFTLPRGYEISLFASEVEFPELQKPVSMAFDAKGRLWVTTMGSYPMYYPGKPVNDKILILEDTDGDGKADKVAVWADGLHLPTGIALGDGGAYVGQQPNVVFLKDTRGTGKADHKEIILSGFDSADSHHAVHNFRWGPGGELYFNEGIFHYSQVETPYGPRRNHNAGVYRYEPKTEKLDVYTSYHFANPWGHYFDRWGQDFIADASGGHNYYATAFSGQVDYPRKQGNMKEFLTKQWRPTCGCVLVSSRQFPDDVQGNYLLNNCIGFQGILQYRVKEDGSGFHADPVEPLLKSSDPNFRPVDLLFGPDGALYVCDWFNPLVGHMQHSLRDPNRDKTHGRIWRITYKDRPLLKQPKIAGQPIPALLDLLKEYEDRTREQARLELRLHDAREVMAELDKWMAKLDTKDKEYQRHLLEALWLCQSHETVDEALLKKLLRSPDARARAAATRVLCYWRDRVKDPLELLRAQVNDDNARVRLEAVRALSFFDGEKAQEVATESLLQPQDYYLEYALKETLATLDQRIKAKKPKK